MTTQQKLIKRKLLSLLKPGGDYRENTEAEFNVTAVYKFDIEEWIGKRKKETENYPGAFFYPCKKDKKE